MKFLTLGALLVGAVSGLVADHLIPGAQIIPAKDTAALRSIGVHRQKYPNRRTVTIRASKSDTDDVSTDFLWGIKQANHGGRLLLQKGKTYVIGKKLDLSFLNDIEVQLDGEIKFTNNITYWQANNFYYDFQKSITFWVWGGQDIKIFGHGTLNGNGQEWYNAFAGQEILNPDNTFYRPILFLTDNATRVSIEGITQLNSPCWTNFFVRTNDISFDNVYINAYSTNASALPKNTDGFDSYNVNGLSVTNTRVDVGDDCFSPKPNTTNIFVQNLWCNNTDNPVVLDQCYFDVNATECAAYPSAVNVTNIVFDNIHGTSSGAEGKVVADLTCSPNAVCSDIHLSRINLTSPAGSPAEIICDGIQGGIGVSCQSSSS